MADLQACQTSNSQANRQTIHQTGKTASNHVSSLSERPYSKQAGLKARQQDGLPARRQACIPASQAVSWLADKPTFPGKFSLRAAKGI
jgi:hypothetical protein